MIGVQAVTGGIIGFAALLAISVTAVVGTVGGSVMYRSRHRVLGAACFVISITLLTGIAIILFQIFKPMPHRDMNIALNELPPSFWTEGDFRCSALPRVNGPESMCISESYRTSLRMTLPDNRVLSANTKLMIATIGKKDAQPRSIEIFESREFAKQDALAFLTQELPTWKNGALNFPEVVRQEQAAFAWLNTLGSLRDERVICSSRQAYDICMRWSKPFSEGRGYTVVYELHPKIK